MLFVISITCMFHLAFAYYIIIHLGYGLMGAAISSAFTYFLNVTIVTIKCSYNSALNESFFLPDRSSFDGLSEYLKIGIPMAL